MSSRVFISLAVSLYGYLLGVASAEVPGRLICVGRVEPTDGEVAVAAQMTGTLSAVFVKEGDWVTRGTVLAEVEARRERASVDLLEAKLARVKAGNGKEEIAAGEASRDAIAAELVYAESDYQRVLRLLELKVVSDDALEQRLQRVTVVRKQLVSAEKYHEALKRGPLREDIALAEAELSAARTAYELRNVLAEADGVILALMRHTGDFVSQNFPSPILRIANTRKLRVRIELNEQDVYLVKEGMRGEFTTFGADKLNGSVSVKTVLPSYSPRRLFEPDSTTRMDTRTLDVLCEIQEGSSQVYSGQRVKVQFSRSGN